ncbi:RNA polymerase sigma-70 factor, ECF subfamily [Saccharicrinis carchari]|uniref:RNA polymerase sigma-70 factor, ECF subfamily n=1 Tax=Saccharicrinis carchari TaxID=1168039 RepID=A0A521B541_SACCC|nr:sigma-70 family RNA polymerase sigma factor [Saccharicrinis carchari]SMO42199.1 RNA polymerase sigma-70 factor, ECF subfamily [Saccharicrinis carchari]
MSLTNDHIQRIAKGDLISFKEIYENMFYSLCLYGYKMISNEDVVRDIVQESFISVWNKRSEFNSLVGTKSYLYTAVRNNILNHIRDSKTVSIEQHTFKEEEESAEFNSQILKEESYKLVRDAVNNLPDQTQKIIMLTLNGCSNQEIADELEISINTVKSLKKVGYAKLRKKLHKYVFALLFISDILNS